MEMKRPHKLIAYKIVVCTNYVLRQWRADVLVAVTWILNRNSSEEGEYMIRSIFDYI